MRLVLIRHGATAWRVAGEHTGRPGGSSGPPTKNLYVVDGHTGREFAVPSKVPHIPMTLDFEQRAECPSVNQCPTQPSAVQIDWVAEYQPEGRA